MYAARPILAPPLALHWIPGKNNRFIPQIKSELHESQFTGNGWNAHNAPSD
jgi:hypothetical protein